MEKRTLIGVGIFVALLFLFAAGAPGQNGKGSLRLLFGADDGVHGMELWSSDGTPAGTSLVKDINPGPTGSGPGELVAMNGLYYFSAYDKNRGRELWATDGSAGGTTLVRDINPGKGDSFPSQLTSSGDRLQGRTDITADTPKSEP